jgi:hypothetical protein
VGAEVLQIEEVAEETSMIQRTRLVRFSWLVAGLGGC